MEDRAGSDVHVLLTYASPRRRKFVDVSIIRPPECADEAARATSAVHVVLAWSPA